MFQVEFKIQLMLSLLPCYSFPSYQNEYSIKTPVFIDKLSLENPKGL